MALSKRTATPSSTVIYEPICGYRKVKDSPSETDEQTYASKTRYVKKLLYTTKHIILNASDTITLTETKTLPISGYEKGVKHYRQAEASLRGITHSIRSMISSRINDYLWEA